MAGAETSSGRPASLDVQHSMGSGRAVHSFKPLVDDISGGAQHELTVNSFHL